MCYGIVSYKGNNCYMKTYMDKLMENKEFKKMFEKEYKKLMKQHLVTPLNNVHHDGNKLVTKGIIGNGLVHHLCYHKKQAIL